MGNQIFPKFFDFSACLGVELCDISIWIQDCLLAFSVQDVRMEYDKAEIDTVSGAIFYDMPD